LVVCLANDVIELKLQCFEIGENRDLEKYIPAVVVIYMALGKTW